jgi:hypothetical protein
MKAIDTRGNFDEFFSDKTRKISKQDLHDRCKIKDGANACRYIVLCSEGFICGKRTPMKDTFDGLVLDKQMIAKGNNCDGLGNAIGVVQCQEKKAEKRKKKRSSPPEDEKNTT